MGDLLMDQRQLARSALANLKSSFKKARVKSKASTSASPLEDIKAALEEAGSVLSQADEEPEIEIELEAEKPNEERPKETVLETYSMAPKALPKQNQIQPQRGRGRPRKVK